MNITVCFICGGSVNNTEIYLSIGRTRYSKTTYPSQISQLIGDDFIVVVSKEDKICQRCASLINRFDKLEMELLEIKAQITGFLSGKYNLGPGENIEDASDDLEYFKEISDLEDKETPEASVLNTMESVSSFGRHDQSPPSDKNDNINNNPSSIILAVPEVDLDCTLVKSETFRDCWTDQSLKMTTIINLSNTGSLNEDFTKHEELLKKPSVPETTQSGEKLPASLPISKSIIPTSTFQDDHKLQEVKKETDSLDHCNPNILLETVQTKTVMNRIKFENMPDLLREFECGNIDNHFELPSDETPINSSQSINKFHSCKGLLNTETKGTALKDLAVKTKQFKNLITNHKKKLQPILPKRNNYVTGTKLPGFDCSGKNIVEINKKLERNESKQKGDLKIPSFKENSTNVLTNDIKEEVIQNKDNSDFSCALCKTEFKNMTTLQKHVKKHYKKELSFSCCFCSKTFKTRSGLYNHTATNHTKKFRFCCEMCGQGFTSQWRLKDHHSSHSKEHPFVCDVCGKTFRSRGTYWIHRKWHSDPLPYRCSDCGQLFKHSSLLSVHKRRKHTGERPFKCPYCVLTFNVSNTFKRHLILHTKNYPYNCDMCKQGFTTRFKYSEHMVKAHLVVIDTPHFEKKNYKVAVYDDKTEEVDSITNNISVTEIVVQGLLTDLNKTTVPCLSQNITANNIV